MTSTLAWSKISFRGVRKAYRARGEDSLVLHGISLDVPAHEFLAVIGKSGCGKTTLLNMVAGFVEPTEGDVLVDGRRVEGPGRDRGMVFQQFALFPWLTALGNVEFGLRVLGLPPHDRCHRALELLRQVGLEGFEGKFMFQLSGGMQQRVALARALAVDPDILLMDEPFGSVDALTRLSLQNELLNIWAMTKKTIMFVTHDIQEALMLADRVVIMSERPGRIVSDIPLELPRPRQRGDVAFGRLADRIYAIIETGGDPDHPNVGEGGAR